VYSVVIILPVFFDEHTQEPTVSSKNLVRRHEPTPGPYSPKSISLYGRGDGTYYTKEKRCQEAEQSDDEFGMTICGVPYPQPVVYQYPDAHPDLEKFPRSEVQVEVAGLQLMKDVDEGAGKYGTL